MRAQRKAKYAPRLCLHALAFMTSSCDFVGEGSCMPIFGTARANTVCSSGQDLGRVVPPGSSWLHARRRLRLYYGLAATPADTLACVHTLHGARRTPRTLCAADTAAGTLLLRQPPPLPQMVYQSIVHTQELMAENQKKKKVDPTYVPDFKAAISNPNAAMEQVLAMKGTRAVKPRFDHSYDQRSSARTLPW